MSERPSPDEEARFLREDFPSRLAHALRTPLGVVGGTLTELERTLGNELAPMHSHLLQLAHRSVRQIDNMAARLSLLARLSGDRLEMQRGPLDVAFEVEHAIEDVRAVRKRSKIVLESSMGSNLPAIIGDGALLRRAFMEVIDNGLRFARARVAVSVDCDATDLVITVDDDGVGVPPEDWPTLFEPFRPRSDRSGLGIGLTLAHEIVTRHDGTMAAEPPPEGGFRMVTRLPAP